MPRCFTLKRTLQRRQIDCMRKEAITAIAIALAIVIDDEIYQDIFSLCTKDNLFISRNVSRITYQSILRR